MARLSFLKYQKRPLPKRSSLSSRTKLYLLFFRL